MFLFIFQITLKFSLFFGVPHVGEGICEKSVDTVIKMWFNRCQGMVFVWIALKQVANFICATVDAAEHQPVGKT